MTEGPYKLPEGWRWVKLRDVLAAVETGLRPKGGVGRLQSGIPSIGGEHLTDNGGFHLSKLRYIPEDFYAKMRRGRIQIGDILVVKDGATTGKVSIVPTDWPFDNSAVNEHIFILRPNKDIIREYLFFYLYSPIGQQEIKKNFQGSAQGGINRSFAEHVNIPLPLLPEQRRIVARIEELMGRVREARRLRAEARQDAERLWQSVLAETFPRPGSALPTGWRWVKLGDVCEVIMGQSPPGSSYNKNSVGIPFFKGKLILEKFTLPLGFGAQNH